jgi:hypothetical protein
MAEHHDYFRNGYEALETFVNALNTLDDRLRWANIGEVCEQTCLRKAAPSGETQVRFYTNRFTLKNISPNAQRYVLQTQHNQPRPAPSVTVDGRNWGCEIKDGVLQIRLSLDRGQSAQIKIASNRHEGELIRWKPSVAHNAKVRMRRILSEFRDNHVDTVLILSRIIARVRAARTERQRAKDQSLSRLRSI